MIAESWRRNWEQIRPFLELPPALRELVYTTNAIESLNNQLRKVIKTKGHFPSDEWGAPESPRQRMHQLLEAAFKLLFLALRNVEQRWRGKVPRHWKQIYAQLHARFDTRAELRE